MKYQKLAEPTIQTPAARPPIPRSGAYIGGGLFTIYGDAMKVPARFMPTKCNENTYDEGNS